MFPGLIVAIALCIALGTILVLLLRRARELQGAREGYAVVALGWVAPDLLDLPAALVLLRTGDPPRLVHVLHRRLLRNHVRLHHDRRHDSDRHRVCPALAASAALPGSLAGRNGDYHSGDRYLPLAGESPATRCSAARSPGPSKDKLKPRLTQTVSILWGVYVLFTAAETLLLWLGPMNLFEAVNHAFATMATGGFSTDNASIAGYQSDYVEWIITIFMYFAGINFLLHFRALRGDLASMHRNPEFRFYNAVVLATIVLATAILYFDGLGPKDIAAESYRHEQMTVQEFDQHYAEESAKVETLYGSFKAATFQALAIVTTTGFATADFDMWPDFLRFLLVLLMFFGGCAGSTGGGMKMIRIMLVLKVAWTVLRKMTQPPTGGTGQDRPAGGR